jgi:phage baseplate assembly protein W
MALTRAQLISQTQKKVETYSDFATSFKPHPTTGELITLKNEDSIKQALKNLILTNIGERLFNPFFGSNVNKTMFELDSPFLVEDMKRYVTNAVNQFEPRVNLLMVDVYDEPDYQRLTVVVTFSVINTSEPISLNLFIRRVR